MSATPVTLGYATPVFTTCPLCGERPTAKTLYGYAVCKKCLYKFANRRQLAYLVDALLFAIPTFAVFFLIQPQIAAATQNVFLTFIASYAMSVALQVLFILKDGFNGQSPGKRLMGVQVVDAATSRPISFGQSLKRNSPFLLGLIPFFGGLIAFAILITIMVQMNKGPRLGDRFAGTRVIWKKYSSSPVFGGDDTRCRQCHYDLTGNTSGTCPECGTPCGEVMTAAPVL